MKSISTCIADAVPTGGSDNKKDLLVELAIAFGLVSLALIYALWPLITAPYETYLVMVDGLGHMTRVEYLAECLRHGQWPSWFPYWYNGATVTQYYPPLSFLILALCQMAFRHVNTSFIIFTFIMQAIGAMGVWYLCYKFIGPRLGIIGAVLYAIHPYLLKMILIYGSVAQGPIFAIVPWFLYFSLDFTFKKNRNSWPLISLTSALLIISHSMHAYLVALCTGILLFLLVIQKRISLPSLFLWLVGTGLGAGIVAFWVLPGITHLEDPFVPYLLPGASNYWAARWNWFTPMNRHAGEFYFSLALLISALGSLLVIRRNKDKAFIIAILGAMLFSIYFSFGDAAPLYKYLPMHLSLITGRFLSYSLLAAILLTLYVIKHVAAFGKSLDFHRQVAVGLLIVIMLVAIGIDINPKVIPITVATYSSEQNRLAQFKTKSPFSQGRLCWLGGGSQVIYFSMLEGRNNTDGWTIEGTPHNRTLWLHNIALTSKCEDYAVHNYLLWNVRTAIIDRRFINVRDALINIGFKQIGKGKYEDILTYPAPSCYFLKQNRNAIAIGNAAPGLVMTFPWMVQGASTSLEDYSSNYLRPFKVIYLAEPEVKDFDKMQGMVKKLAQDGKMVIVEMGHKDTWPLLGIIPYWEKISGNASLISTLDSPFRINIPLQADPGGRYPAMGNLDGILGEMVTPDRRVPALGYKYVGKNKIYFAGLALSQNTEAAVKKNFGFEAKAPNSQEFINLLGNLLDIGKPNKSIFPTPFGVTQEKWTYNSFSFKYKTLESNPIVVSVTYSPHWQAKIDGKALKVDKLENLILINLPAGKHQVDFEYRMTWVGWLGLVISILTSLLVIFISLKMNAIEHMLKMVRSSFIKGLAKVTD